MGLYVSKSKDAGAGVLAPSGDDSLQVKDVRTECPQEFPPWAASETCYGVNGPCQCGPAQRVNNAVLDSWQVPQPEPLSMAKSAVAATKDPMPAPEALVLTTNTAAAAASSFGIRRPSSAKEPMRTNQSFEALYSVETENIGQGTFGVVRRATSKLTGKCSAVKIIRKNKVKNMEQLQQEVTNMWTLDHPNIVKLYDAFDDQQTVSLVLELCAGGELFHAISKAKRLSEQDTSIVMEQMLCAVFHLHSLSICHRDLKPENFLFLTTLPIHSNVLKLIDFGLSVTCLPGQELTEVVGTATYVSPQVLSRSYNVQCDLWSCGIIMYIMLCGHPPFRGKAQPQLLAKVLDGHFVFDASVWKTISHAAKEMITMLLQKDPLQRYTAEQALTDPWLLLALPQSQPSVDSSLQHFRVSSSSKSELWALDNRFPFQQANPLADILRALDTDNDGMLSIHDLKEGFLLAGIQKQSLECFNHEGIGYVNYHEVLNSMKARASERRGDIDSMNIVDV